MTTKGMNQSRRSLLKRGLWLTAGAVGVGAGAGAGAKLAGDERETTLRVDGRNFRLQIQDRRPGERLRVGDRGVVYGELLDTSGGAFGSFYGSRVAVESTPGSLVADGALESHTFRLPAGTILGIGSHVEGESVFSIIGGTGAYAGARGSYSSSQFLREHGGDGTAEFVLNLTA